MLGISPFATEWSKHHGAGCPGPRCIWREGKLPALFPILKGNSTKLFLGLLLIWKKTQFFLHSWLYPYPSLTVLMWMQNLFHIMREFLQTCTIKTRRSLRILFFLYFPSMEPDLSFKLVLSKNSPGFLKVCQSFSLAIGWFFSLVFRGMFIRLLNTDRWIIQS